MMCEEELGSPAIEPAPVRDAYRAMRVDFMGDANEYFRIWIVDTALTLVTLGLYSPWAAVRKKRYFAENTYLDGANFEYVGSARALAVRRLVVVALLAGLGVGSQHASGRWWLALLAAALFVALWVWLEPRTFDLENTSYRNVRFQFAARARELLTFCAKSALFYVASLGLAHPYVVFSRHRFLVTRCRWGALRFEWHASSGQYIGAYAFVGCLTYPVYAALVDFGRLGNAAGWDLARMLLPGVPLLAAYLLLPLAFLNASLKNQFYSGMHVGEHMLSANFRAQDLLMLYATNTLAVIASFGFLIPWARVRTAAYEASCLTLHVRR